MRRSLLCRDAKNWQTVESANTPSLCGDVYVGVADAGRSGVTGGTENWEIVYFDCVVVLWLSYLTEQYTG